MDIYIFDKLRAEIADERKLRHNLIMKKFAFLTVFIGTGAINILSESPIPLDLSMLLFIVPFIAVAFDLYIFVEDYRIKRVGEFLRQLAKHPTADDKQKSEGIWEDFVAANPNKASTYAFFAVTLIYAFASILLLIQLDYKWWYLVVCFGVAATIEGIILYHHIILRRNLKKTQINFANMTIERIA